MKLIFFLLIAATSVSGLSSCSSSKPASAQDKPEKIENQGPSLVGRIASVPSDKRFVLVQRYGKWEGHTGQILTTRGPENRTANLRTTGEKLGEFAAADVQSGIVGLGDAVYLQHVPKPVAAPTPAEPLPSAEPPTPNLSAAGDLENVQKNN